MGVGTFQWNIQKVFEIRHQRAQRQNKICIYVKACQVDTDSNIF